MYRFAAHTRTMFESTGRPSFTWSLWESFIVLSRGKQDLKDDKTLVKCYRVFWSAENGLANKLHLSLLPSHNHEHHRHDYPYSVFKLMYLKLNGGKVCHSHSITRQDRSSTKLIMTAHQLVLKWVLVACAIRRVNAEACRWSLNSTG